MNEVRLARILSRIIELRTNATDSELIKNLDQLQEIVIRKYLEITGKGHSYEC